MMTRAAPADSFAGPLLAAGARCAAILPPFLVPYSSSDDALAGDRPSLSNKPL